MKLTFMDAAERYGVVYADYAEFFRRISLQIDQHPDSLLDYCNHTSIQTLLIDNESTTLERTCRLEAYSYGDPGVVLACPGPSLAGLMIRELGTKEQQENFNHFLIKNNARTFFALTEPLKGSDAGALQCKLTPKLSYKKCYLLNGEKCLFGNGAVGKIGVILARTHDGPLGIRAILITPDLLNSNQGWINRESLPMAGLRGAQIAYMNFSNCPIDTENLLGEQLRPMQHGMMAVIKTFNRLRSGVGALAIGQAQAILDYLYLSKTTWNNFERSLYSHLYYKIESARQLLRKSAQKIDVNPFDTFSISIAKIQATQIAERVVTDCLSMLDEVVLLENEWLAKCYRDCFAWEYMEGTRTMQLKNVFQYMSNHFYTRHDVA